MATQTAFKDSMLDYSDMMTDPHQFAKRVFDKADEYKEICKADISIAALTRQMEDSLQEADPSIHVLFNAVYNYSDEFPLEQMPAVITAARQLVKDLETAFSDRVIREAAAQADPSKDKKLAHAMYMDLRKTYNDYAKFMNNMALMFPDLENNPLKEIPALPGNYGSSTTALKHYVFVHNNEEFRNPVALCRELGIDRIVMYDDMLEYIEAHPDLEVIVKVVM